MDHIPHKRRPSKITAIRLPWETVRKIDARVGRGNRSKFLIAAVERELKRQARLDHISTSEGFIGDEMDTLAFVNHLRTLADTITLGRPVRHKAGITSKPARLK